MNRRNFEHRNFEGRNYDCRNNETRNFAPDPSHNTLAPPITTCVRDKEEELAEATVDGHVNWLTAMSRKSTAPGKAVTKLTSKGGEDLDLPPCLGATRDQGGTFTLGAAEGG